MIGSAASGVAAAATSGAARGAGRMLAWRVHAYAEPHEAAGAPRLEEARVPPLRAPDDLLVRVRAASVNPIDVAMIGGYGSVALNAQRRLLGAGAGHVEFPLTVGRDFCGVVEARGAAVDDARLRRGARVWGALPPHAVAGAHAQFVRVKRDWVSPAPEALSDAECAGAPYAALTAMALVRAAALPPPPSAPRVLLLGLGGVGQAALQLLAARGVHVTVSAAPDQEQRARALGARDFIHKEGGAGGAGGGYAAVLDCAGLGGEAADMQRWSFARYATLTSPVLRETDARGLVAGAAAAAARLAAQCARAAALPAPAPAPAACVPRVRWAFFSARGADLEELRRLAERGQFGVRVERVFAWRDAAAAYARAAEGAARGKLVIDFNTCADPTQATYL